MEKKEITIVIEGDRILNEKLISKIIDAKEKATTEFEYDQIKSISSIVPAKNALLLNFLRNLGDTVADEVTYMERKKDIALDGQEYSLSIISTSYDPDLKKKRQEAYAKADVFITIFEAGDSSSFDGVLEDWIPGILKTNPDTPILLVELPNPNNGQLPNNNEKQLIAQANHLQATIGYQECDLETKASINNVFISAIDMTEASMSVKALPLAFS